MIVKPPFLPISGSNTIKKIVDTAVKIGKAVFNVIFDKETKQTAEEIGQAKALDEENMQITDIAQLNKILTGFLKQVEQKADDVECKILNEASYFFEEFIDILRDNDEILKFYNINISRIERKLINLKSKLKGLLKNEISRYISLDNYECKSILKMRAGDKKAQKMKDFADDVIKRSIEKVIEKIKEDLEEYGEDISYIIEDGIDKIEKNILNQNDILEELEKEKLSNEQKVEMIKNKAQLVIDICEYGILELN